MRAQLAVFVTTLVAAVSAQLIAAYLVNNSRAVRNIVGPL